LSHRPSWNLDGDGRPAQARRIILPEERKPVVAGSIEGPVTQQAVVLLLIDDYEGKVVIGMKIGEFVVPTFCTPDEADAYADLVKARAAKVRGEGGDSCPTACPVSSPPDSPPVAATATTTDPLETLMESVSITVTCGDDCDCQSCDKTLCASGASRRSSW
jgi:hypothetical protein